MTMERRERKGWRIPAGCVFGGRRYVPLVVAPLVLLLYWIHAERGRGGLPPAASGSRLARPHEASGDYLVDTPTCQIPNVDPFDPTVRKFARTPQPILCNRDPPPLTYSDIDSVYLLRERQHLYGARPPLTTVACCTRDINWDDDAAQRLIHTNFTSRAEYELGRISLSPQCRRLTSRYTPATAGGVEVICSVNKTIVYRDYYHFVPIRPRLEAASRQRAPQEVAPSVLIFMFDSLSRLQFRRWFPRTRRFLAERMEAFELGGLNKNGDNTWPNMAQLLAGMDEDRLRRECAPDVGNDPLDGCPFMWRQFKKAGYRTALAEDSTGMGVFNYLKMGFVRQPTDYYSRPTALLSEEHIGYERPLNTFLCEGSRHSFESTFKFTQDLATRMADRPYWAFVAQSVYSHDFFNLPYFLDVPYQHLLETLLTSDALNNTVLVTMGDHGLRWGEERRTFIGSLEERLPLVSLYFPRWMRRRYPAAFDNLRVNQRRLTTFRDLHRTLMDLLKPEETMGAADARPAPADASMVSLFRRVSPLRRCEHVQVPQHFCTCLRTEAISTQEPGARLAAEAVVAAVNAQLAPVPQCARLRLARVLVARLARPPDADRWTRSSVFRQMVTVQIETAPGGAKFEATVIGNGTTLVLGGAVSRLDRYGHLAQCVREHRLEKLCHCRGRRDKGAPTSAAVAAPAAVAAAAPAVAAAARTDAPAPSPGSGGGGGVARPAFEPPPSDGPGQSDVPKRKTWVSAGGPGGDIERTLTEPPHQ